MHHQLAVVLVLFHAVKSSFATNRIIFKKFSNEAKIIIAQRNELHENIATVLECLRKCIERKSFCKSLSYNKVDKICSLHEEHADDIEKESASNWSIYADIGT